MYDEFRFPLVVYFIIVFLLFISVRHFYFTWHAKKFCIFHAVGKAGIDIVHVFISVDPERDTVEQVHDYGKGGFF